MQKQRREKDVSNAGKTIDVTRGIPASRDFPGSSQAGSGAGGAIKSIFGSDSRKEQIEAIRKEIPARFTEAGKPEGPLKPKEEITYSESQRDRIADFFYFNDFYIISAVITFLILWVTFVA